MSTIKKTKAYIYQNGEYQQIDGSTQLVAEYLNSESDLPAVGDPNKIYLTPASPMNAEIYNAIYPVGSIKAFYDNEDHGNFLGQTWERYAEGKVLVGLDANDTDFDTIGKEGGEKTHTLTVNEMPSHNHTAHLESGSFSGTSGNLQWTGSDHSHQRYGLSIDNTGGGQAHNNLQPYAVVNYWKRIA